MANCLPYSILISPSSAKSIFPDSFAGLNKHHKSSLFKFRGRAFSFRSDQRRHTLTRRLRHLAASKARSSRALSPRFFGSPRGSAVAPQPLPLPDAVHTLPPSYSTVNTRLPLPKTEKAPTPAKCKREKREQSDALRRDANGNGDAGFASSPASHDSRRNTDHADTLASRRSLRKPNGTKKYMLNVPISIPRNPFSSLSQSPHRSISDIFTTHYMSPPVFQASYASELPLSDMTPGLGFSYQKPYESIAFSVDNSSIHSSRVSFGHNVISPNRPVSPLHNRLLTDTSMAPRDGLNAINSCGPLSPWHITLSTVTSMAQRESNAQSKVHPHPLPLPPNAAILPSQPAPSPKVTDNLESIKSRWKKGKLIGRGTFGSVYVGSNRETGALCAMKEVELIPDDPKSSECIRQIEQEIKVLSQLKHTNIVQYYGSEIVGDRFYIYLEYVHPGSIVKYVHGHCGAITESVVQNFTRHILSGLAYLHSTKTIHRDIKGANLLVDTYGVVKLADFGMAKHVEANVGVPQVNYRERISKVSEVKYVHKKQSGGQGQFADITVRFEPMEAGSGYEFKSEIKGGAVPREYIPGVMKGLEECMSNGVLAGFPVVDVRAVLVDGSYHDVDSSVLAFQLAGKGAFREGMRKAGSKILEPIMKVEVVTPEEHLGDVIGDLNSRRGQINSFGDKPGGLKRLR